MSIAATKFRNEKLSCASVRADTFVLSLDVFTRGRSGSPPAATAGTKEATTRLPIQSSESNAHGAKHVSSFLCYTPRSPEVLENRSFISRSRKFSQRREKMAPRDAPVRRLHRDHSLVSHISYVPALVVEEDHVRELQLAASSQHLGSVSLNLIEMPRLRAVVDLRKRDRVAHGLWLFLYCGRGPSPPSCSAYSYPELPEQLVGPARLVAATRNRDFRARVVETDGQPRRLLLLQLAKEATLIHLPQVVTWWGGFRFQPLTPNVPRVNLEREFDTD